MSALQSFLMSIILIGFIMVGYIGLTKAYDVMYTWQGTNITNANSKTTALIINQAWIWFPFVILVAWMAYMIQKGHVKTFQEEDLWP